MAKKTEKLSREQGVTPVVALYLNRGLRSQVIHDKCSKHLHLKRRVVSEASTSGLSSAIARIGGVSVGVDDRR